MVRTEAGTKTPERALNDPLFFLAAAFAAGAAISEYAPFEFAPLVSALFALIAVAGRGSRPATISVCIAFFFAGAFSYSVADRPPPDDSLRGMLDSGRIVSGDPVEIEGVVEAGPELLPGGRSFDIAAGSVRYKRRSARVSGRVRFHVSLNDEAADRVFEDLLVKPGTPVRVAALVSREERFNNPGMFSFVKLLEREGLDAVASVKSPLLIERAAEDRFRLAAYANDLRNGLIARVLARFEQPASGVLVASVLGNKHFLEKGSAEIYRNGGTFHVLVVSGLHVTIVGGAVIWMLSAAGLRRTWSAPAACFAVWSFAVIAGGGTPVVRASLMFTFLAAAHVFSRTGSQLNALGAASLLILVLDPKAVFDPSFQLTVLAVAAIAGAAFPLISKLREIGSWKPSARTPLPPRCGRTLRVFSELLHWDQRAWGIVREGAVWECGLFKSPFAKRYGGGFSQKLARIAFEALLVSSILQVCLLPLQVVYFHRIAPAGAILNLGAGIAFVLQTALAAVALAASLLSETIAVPFAALAEVVSASWLATQNAVGATAGGSFRVPVYSGTLRFVYPAYFLTVLVSAVFLNIWDPFAVRHRLKSPKAAAVCIGATLFIGALIVLHPWSEPQADGRLTAHFLDVGQGDSTFLVFPDGKTMLIDGGGRRSFTREAEGGFERDIRGIGEAVVSEFLWENGYSSIDAVVLTHGDADHIQGLIEVVRNFSIGSIFVGAREPSNPAFEKLEEEAVRRGIPLAGVFEGDRFSFGGASVEVLNPDPTAAPTEDSDNDNSVVLRVEYVARSFLLTGDIERGAETRIARHRIRADVVKVAHHGSRTSSSEVFVNTVGADFAVIPVGKRSQFGHPHRGVVERWQASGARVFTTGRSGTVTISTDGSLLEVRTYLPEGAIP
ncbi:MAG: ComEC/Rec2 family competence protein [Acidobacteriota bacterium]|nr:MAG: ComEC/Rec2 family competence protein [Acidobacteriota bacterium]